MRFEPQPFEDLFIRLGLDPDGREYRALRRRLVLGEEFHEIADALGITEKSAREYCRLAWRQVFPPVEGRKSAQAAATRVIQVIEAAVWTIDPSREVEYEDEPLDPLGFWLFILKECGALRFLKGGARGGDWDRPALMEEASIRA